MEDTFFLLLFGGTIILGVVGTVAYYFARYGFRASEDKSLSPPPEPPPEPRPEPPPEPGSESGSGSGSGSEPELAYRSELADPTKPAGLGPVLESERIGLPTRLTESERPAKPEDLKSLSQALKSTQQSLWGRIKMVLSGQEQAEIREEIEEILFTSDLGVATVERLMNAVDTKISRTSWKNESEVRQALRFEMNQILKGAPRHLPELPLKSGGVRVWLVVGVNGVGKTTTIGKLAHWAASRGAKVLVAAGDTFRAAAGAQLKTWSERAQVEIYSPEGVMEPAAVAYQAFEKGKQDGCDLVIVDTAGRLHTQKNLMEELKKVKRVLGKLDPKAPHETLLVLDANSGQNALAQAREFHQALQLTGAVLTKMDGTAKGGVALGLAAEMRLPLIWIGVGENLNDLRSFQVEEYIDAII